MNSELWAQGPYPIGFDSDSPPIGINTHASRCMANAPHLFEDLRLSNKGKVQGINNGLEIKGKGTFKIKIEDDNGRTHEIKIPNSLYLPGLERCLLSPQHWAQEAGDEHPLPEGAWCKNTATHNILFWDQKYFQKSVPHSSLMNTPVFYTAPSSRAYQAFTSTFEALEAPFFCQEHVLQYPGQRPIATEGPFDPMDLLSREEFIAEENLNLEKQKRMLVNEGVTLDNETVQTSNLLSTPANDEPHPGTACQGALTVNPSPPLEKDEEFQLAAADNQAELMQWHYRLSHLSFPKLKVLANNGKIPCRLAKVPPPKCAGCLFGAMTKLPWRGKESKATHQVFVATKPGECMSIDHMVSTHVGFFVQLKGGLTKKRYKAASIFVDHFLCLCFVYLMQDLSSEESVKAKRAFEQFAAEHGIVIRHYHCNNGHFANNAFNEACQQSNQQLTFCNVNAHFQNGIAERAICDLSNRAYKQLLHTCQQWPAAVHVALWPYTLCSAVLLHNALPVLEDGTSRHELFRSIPVGANMKHVHTFACPVFALQNALAAGNAVPKWSPRAQLGLNLGPSPMHARNVYLVLNLSTRLFSPQYHCCFEDFFETTKYGGPDVSVSSTWQQLARLGHANEIPSQGLLQMLHSPMSTETPSDIDVPSEEPPVSNDKFAVTWDEQLTPSKILKSQQTNKTHRLLKKLRELLPLLQPSQLVQVDMAEFALCQRRWLTQCHSKISTATPICTTWLRSHLWVRQMKTSSMTHTSSYKNA
jgi:hypothetical protein